uniref:Uncharacterized protein n=1 Tax=Pyramimonas orientalis virus TaxID=455367 RepID=A0A7L9AZ60_POV01|nr:hypothetical protein HWQ62_00469 [Pyramimonas orientalis virus]
MTLQIVHCSAVTPSSTKQLNTFQRQLYHYNVQLSKNNKSIKKLIVNLNTNCKNTTNSETTSCDAIYFELEDIISKNRRVVNLKKKLYLKNHFDWDEEFY